MLRPDRRTRYNRRGGWGRGAAGRGRLLADNLTAGADVGRGEAGATVAAPASSRDAAPPPAARVSPTSSCVDSAVSAIDSVDGTIDSVDGATDSVDSTIDSIDSTIDSDAGAVGSSRTT